MAQKEICPVCDGAGKLVITDDYGNKRVVACFTCRGSGRVEDTDTYPMCGGSGEVWAQGLSLAKAGATSTPSGS